MIASQELAWRIGVELGYPIFWISVVPGCSLTSKILSAQSFCDRWFGLYNAYTHPLGNLWKINSGHIAMLADQDMKLTQSSHVS